MDPLKKISYWLMVATMAVSCSSPEKITAPSELLKERLISFQGKGMLFGHQDGLAYGMGWWLEDDRSDVKSIAGDYQSLFGWELGGIERGDSLNLDSLSFKAIHQLAVKGHHMGGINTFSWHPYSPVDGRSSWDTSDSVVAHIIPGGSYHLKYQAQLDSLAVFFSSLTDSTGKLVPFIFRPFHEMDGNWFWWGRTVCSPDEFKRLFVFTIDYLRNEKKLTNMLVAYSPDRHFDNEEQYLTWYAGDNWVDVMGMDNYYDLRTPEGDDALAKKRLKIVVETAKKHNKISAFTETGCSNMTDSTWFTQKLWPVLEQPEVLSHLSYVMVWRSDPRHHFFFPYVGHPAEQDTRRFLNKESIWLLEQLNQNAPLK